MKSTPTYQDSNLTGLEGMAFSFFREKGIHDSWAQVLEAAIRAFPELDREDAVLSYFDATVARIKRDFKPTATEAEVRGVAEQQRRKSLQ